MRDTWLSNRLIMPNGRSIMLERQPGADAEGYAGLEDEVDNHWGMLFKALSPCGRPRARLLGPGQSDFGRIYIPSGKDALGSMHWNVDHCPVAMQFDEPAAVDGP
jgi:Bacterial conjugation TrbI-like protein